MNTDETYSPKFNGKFIIIYVFMTIFLDDGGNLFLRIKLPKSSEKIT